MSNKWLQTVLTGFMVVVTACAGAGGQSLDDLRSEFVAAGGTCSASGPITTTTTASKSKAKSGQHQPLENLDCGKDEAGISRYESQQDARISWWALSSFLDGFMLSLGSDPSETQSIIKGNFRIYLPLGEYSTARVDNIAREIGGTVLSSRDLALRREILASVSSGSGNGGLDTIANSCIMQKNLSSDKQSIEVDTKGKDDSDGDSLASVFCLLRATVAPDFIFDSIKRTRALDGRLQETYGDYRVSWNYHPDSGLKLSLIFVG